MKQLKNTKERKEKKHQQTGTITGIIRNSRKSKLLLRYIQASSQCDHFKENFSWKITLELNKTTDVRHQIKHTRGSFYVLHGSDLPKHVLL